MKGDYLSAKRAASVASLGLLVQTVLGIVLLVQAILGGDHAAFAGSFWILIGSIGWLTLLITYDQIRRERIEAMEAESFAASDAATSSVFEEGASDLRVAARRLKTLQRLFVPGMSLLIGVLLIALGAWFYRTGLTRIEDGRFGSTVPAGWTIAISVILAFFGFVLARYVAGMSKNKVWGSLRAGASASAGMALIGLVLVVAHLAALAEIDQPLRWLNVIIPALMFIIGVETLVMFLLDLYRPRKVGEVQKPAFDSRLLGFLSAPDKIARSIGEAINYQFGSDVSSSWQYRLIARSVWPLLIVGVMVVWLMSSFVVVQPHQRGMILRNGSVVRSDIGPGLHFKYPWPIEKLVVPEYIKRDEKGKVIKPTQHTATGIRTLPVGTFPPSDKEQAILWTTGHGGAYEKFFIVQPSKALSTFVSGEESQATVGADVALVAVEIPLIFRVNKVEAFERLAPSEMRDQLVLGAAQRAAMQYLATRNLDDVLDAKRADLAGELLARIRESVNDMCRQITGDDSLVDGIEILYVGSEGTHPPKEVADSFEMVVEAEQKYVARLESARSEARELLTLVAGSEEAAKVIVASIDELGRLQREVSVGNRTPEQLAAIEAQDDAIADLIEQEAAGEVAATLAQAAADRWTQHMKQRGAASEVEGLRGYAQFTGVYQSLVYYETLKNALEGKRLYLFDDRDVAINLRALITDERSAGNIMTEITKQQDQ